MLLVELLKSRQSSLIAAFAALGKARFILVILGQVFASFGASEKDNRDIGWD